MASSLKEETQANAKLVQKDAQIAQEIAQLQIVPPALPAQSTISLPITQHAMPALTAQHLLEELLQTAVPALPTVLLASTTLPTTA